MKPTLKDERMTIIPPLLAALAPIALLRLVVAANPRLAVLGGARLERPGGASLAREYTAEAALVRVAGHIIMPVAPVAALLVLAPVDVRLLVRVLGIDAAPAIRIERIAVVETGGQTEKVRDTNVLR